MNDKFIKTLIQIVSDNIDFNNKIRDLVEVRNKAIAEALDLFVNEYESRRTTNQK